MKTSEILKKYNIKLKKSLGQNFLSDSKYAQKIVSSINLTEEDTVIEIGAGAGTLTEEICKSKAKVIAYEIDTNLKKLLNNKFKEDKVRIFFEDFLQVNLSEYMNEKISYIANIPYNISSPLLEKIFTETPQFNQAILMVQKEFGERILAKSGKNYSPLSIFAQFHCDISKLIEVPKSAFVPNPNIDSIVLKFIPNLKDKKIDRKKFLVFVQTCFSQRRKTLKNNLKKYFSDPEKQLTELEIHLMARPENISIYQYINLYKMQDIE